MASVSISEQVELQKIAGTFKTLLQVLVDKPDEVQAFLQIDSAGAATFRISVPDGEAGKVIGKNGRTAQALRILLQCAGKKLNRSIALDVVVSS